jgi:hypothetical protein
MATKFTQAQRDEWIDIQMRKAEVLEALDALEVVEPVDIEASRQEEIDAVEAQIVEIYEEKQARANSDNPMSREEYVSRTEPLIRQKIPIMEQEEQLKARNEMRWGNAHRAFETAKATKMEEIKTLKVGEKETFKFTPPFTEKNVEK